MKSKPIIKLENVWKIYQMGDVTVNALCGLNLEINPHEFVAIQGPSGSGKSTAMALIGCLDLPSKGKVYLAGQDISTLSESDLAQIRGRKIGFIFQQFNLIGTLNVLENVMLPTMFQHVSLSERQKKAMDLLNLVELGDRIFHKPSELSGGQQQRVAIARALVNDPEVILADEPTGNLDSKTGIIILNFLKKLHKNGKTIILVTHDSKLAKSAQKIKYLKDGKIVEKL